MNHTSVAPFVASKDLRSRGVIIFLKKESILKGKTSKIKPDTVRMGTLAKPIEVGHPLCIRNQDSEGSFRDGYHALTTTITDIQPAEEKDGLILTTETSTYYLY